MSEQHADFADALLSKSPHGSWWDPVVDTKLDQQEAIGVAADLHNSGKIDFIRLFLERPIEQSDRRYLRARSFFCRLLPLIHGSVPDVVATVDKLIELGARDIGESRPRQALFEWCCNSAQGPREALEFIRTHRCDGLSLLSTVLEAGANFDRSAYVREAIEIMMLPSEIRFAAIHAVGRIDVSDNKELQDRVLNALIDTYTSSDDDLVIASIIDALFSMCFRDVDLWGRGKNLIIREASRHGGPAAHQAIVVGLLKHHAELPGDVLDAALGALVHVDPQQERALQTIDYLLADVDLVANEDRILSVVRNLLLSHGGALKLDSFPHFLSHITNHVDLVNRLACRWLREGDRVLCESIAAIFRSNPTDCADFSVDFASLEYSDAEIVFICRKAIGYMSAQPTVVSCFLVSALREVKADAADAISELMFNPVLMNSRGEAKAYMEKVAADETDPATGRVSVVLKRFDAYLLDLQSVGRLPELEPSERRRMIAREWRNELLSQACERARKNSIVSLIATERTILYGSGTVTYFAPNVKGKRFRNETEFETHASSIEWPALESIDPCGSRYRIFELREEEWSQ